VKIEATALNPVDWKILKLGIFVEKYPAVIGYDIAGVVDDVGEGVSTFVKGDKVFFMSNFSYGRGGFQEYAIADAEHTAKIPSHLSFDEAAATPCAIAAAVTGLYCAKPHGAELTLPLEPSERGKDAGKPLIVLGGATSVGQYVIQFGKLSGCSPIIVTASLKHEAMLKSLGATHVIDRQIPLASLRSEIEQITTLPLETVYDAVSIPETQQAGYDLLAPGGFMVLVLPPAIEPKEGKDFYLIWGVWILPHTRELGAKLHERLSGLFEEGVLHPLKVEVVPGGLNGVAEGFKRLEAEQVSGFKLVIRPQETA